VLQWTPPWNKAAILLPKAIKPVKRATMVPQVAQKRLDPILLRILLPEWVNPLYRC
jgi:hypothetical protein